jgi:release factor glutamine methyltransferase
MKTAIRHIVARTYKPLLVKWLSKDRTYSYEGIRLRISPQVFHPGFFFSTNLLLNYIKQLPLKGKTFLEPGCGSGLISFLAAKKGATVTASDINAVAIEYIRKNVQYNGIDINVIYSDLFHNIPPQAFDYIAINPPYYKKQPVAPRDYAWCCGENGEYFDGLFSQLANYIHPTSEIIMVAYEGCDMEMIENLAVRYGFELVKVETHKNWLETNFIFRIELIK